MKCLWWQMSWQCYSLAKSAEFDALLLSYGSCLLLWWHGSMVMLGQKTIYHIWIWAEEASCINKRPKHGWKASQVKHKSELSHVGFMMCEEKAGLCLDNVSNSLLQGIKTAPAYFVPDSPNSPLLGELLALYLLLVPKSWFAVCFLQDVCEAIWRAASQNPFWSRKEMYCCRRSQKNLLDAVIQILVMVSSGLLLLPVALPARYKIDGMRPVIQSNDFLYSLRQYMSGRHTRRSWSMSQQGCKFVPTVTSFCNHETFLQQNSKASRSYSFWLWQLSIACNLTLITWIVVLSSTRHTLNYGILGQV